MKKYFQDHNPGVMKIAAQGLRCQENVRESGIVKLRITSNSE